MQNILIRQANISGKIKDILIVDGKITNIDNDIKNEQNVSIVNAQKNLVLPSAIDLCLYSKSYNEIIQIKQLAHSFGISNFAIMLNEDYCINNIQELMFYKSYHQNLIVSLTENNLGKKMNSINLLFKKGAKLFTNYLNSFEDNAFAYKAFLYSKTFDIPLMLFVQDRHMAQNAHLHDGKHAAFSGILGIPRIAEILELQKVIAIAKDVGNKIHVSNITTKEAVKIIGEAKKQGVNITADVAITNLIFDDNDFLKENLTTRLKVNPPIREASDKEALIEGVSQKVIDVISSHNSMINNNYKNLPFEQASFGIQSFNTFYSDVLTLQNSINLQTLLLAINQNPASILNIESNKIEVGSSANLVIINNNAITTSIINGEIVRPN